MSRTQIPSDLLLTDHSSWQVRFLSKTYTLLRSLATHDNRYVVEISQTRCRDILGHVQRLMTYLMVLFAEYGGVDGPHPPSRALSVRRIDGLHRFQEVVHDRARRQPVDESDSYYLTLTIWYLLGNWREAIDMHVLRKAKSQILKMTPRDSQYIGKENMAKTHILRWFYHESVRHIDEVLSEPEPLLHTEGHEEEDEQEYVQDEADDSDGYSFELPSLLAEGEIWDEENPHIRAALVTKWRTAAQRSLTAKTASRDAYTEDDEQCDRLILLAKKELRWSDAEICTNLVLKRISDRVRTTSLNPGALPPELDGSFPIPKSPPWELHALCHHIRLLSSLYVDQGDDKPDDDTLEQYSKRCLLFMTGEGTVMATWDRNNDKALQGWFGLETSCVVAASLVDMLLRLCIESEISGTALTTGRPASPDSTHSNGATLGTNTSERRDRAQPRRANSTFSIMSAGTLGSDGALHDADDVQKATLSRISELLEAFRQANKSFRPFNWKTYQPPAPYHMHSFYNSLDDSPHLFKAAETRRVQMRENLRRWLRMDDNYDSYPDWNINNLEKHFPTQEILLLSIIDFKKARPSPDPRVIEPANPFVIGRISRSREIWEDGKYSILLVDAHPHREFLKKIQDVPALGADTDNLAAQIFYELIDIHFLKNGLMYWHRPEVHAFYRSLEKDELDLVAKMGDRAWSRIQSNLLAALCDSVSPRDLAENMSNYLPTRVGQLVDQQVQYRILFDPSPSENLNATALTDDPVAVSCRGALGR